MTIQMNSSSEEWEAHRQTLIAETKVGGSLPEKCFKCRLPLCDRSDYVRCSRCGLNWPKGYDYSKHPSTAWQQKEDADRKARS